MLLHEVTVACARTVLVRSHWFLLELCTNLQHCLDILSNLVLEFIERFLPMAELTFYRWSSLVAFGHHLKQRLLLAIVQQPTVLFELIQAGF